ncbi:MAG: SRPBCC domain-containing protein [Acidimicrobiales bacterium]
MSETPVENERVVSIFIDAPIQQVWDEITKTAGVQRPLYNTVLSGDLTPGSRLRYASPDHKRVFVVGEVIEVTPPTRFVHTYIMTIDPDPETTVAWDLAEEGSGCRVTLTHSGWTDEHRTAEKTVKTWTEILGLVKSEVESGTIPLKTRLTYGAMRLFSFALPKRTSADYADEQGW